jgi:hypothetical protein
MIYLAIGEAKVGHTPCQLSETLAGGGWEAH